MFLRKIKDYWYLVVKKDRKQKSVCLGKVQNEVARELKRILELQRLEKKKEKNNTHFSV